MYEVKKINQVFQLMKGNDVKRLEAEQKPAPVEKPKKAKKVKKEKKVEKNVRKTDMDA